MPTIDTLVTDLREQWQAIRDWAEELPDPGADEVLPCGWTIAHTLADTGRVLRPLANLTLHAPDDDALELPDYLPQLGGSGLPEQTAALALQVQADPLAGLDEIAETAFDRLQWLRQDGVRRAGLDDIADAVVATPAGLVDLDAYLTGALIELVCRGYDLAPALPTPAPIDPTARTLVAQALLDVVSERTGYQLQLGDADAWIGAARGQIDWARAVERAAVRPAAISDGTPDLSGSLPLL